MKFMSNSYFIFNADMINVLIFGYHRTRIIVVLEIFDDNHSILEF